MNNEFKKWFAARARNPDRITLEEAFYAGASAQQRAQPAPVVPEGWKLAPIVSTHEMDYAGSDHCDGYLSTAQVVWDAMLAAAPEAKP